MNEQYIWIIMIGIIIILGIIIFRALTNFFENRKIEKILNYIDNKAKEKEYRKRFQECLDIIEKCNKEKENENGERN